MDKGERSPAARQRAEAALVRLVWELRDDDPFLVVLGGLVPRFLADEEQGVIPEHLGTTDIDILLITHLDADADLGAVERALARLEFAPTHSDGWRWRGVVDAAPVIVEFLCDLPEYREGEYIRPRGCEKLAAVNLRGTGYVARDFRRHDLSGELPDGTPVEVSVRCAGLGGYLLSKCVSVRTRGAEKDYYDLVYVLAHSRAGGPEAAAQELVEGSLSDDVGHLRSTLLEVRERYRETTDPGPRGYALQASQVELDADERRRRATPTSGCCGPMPWTSCSASVPRSAYRSPRGTPASHHTCANTNTVQRAGAVGHPYGRGEIRTPEAGVARLPVFKTGAFNRSATLPGGSCEGYRQAL